MKKTPKVAAYLLFMQEQRVTVPGWINKSNSELQLLCDPFWKRLTEAEKSKYKEMKKSLRRKDREMRVSGRIPQEVKKIEFEGKQWPITVGQVESPDFVWVVPDHSSPEVHKLLVDLGRLPLEVFQVGMLPSASFSSDGKIYRCRVAAVKEWLPHLQRFVGWLKLSD